MSDNKVKNIAEIGAENGTGAAEALTLEKTQAAAETATEGAENADVGVYTHTFKKPFEYEGKTYEELTFNFGKLKGRDMVAIENEMQGLSEYALAPEISTSFQSKMAAGAAGIGSDVLEAMPLKDFNKITGAARRFLLDSGY